MCEATDFWRRSAEHRFELLKEADRKATMAMLMVERLKEEKSRLIRELADLKRQMDHRDGAPSMFSYAHELEMPWSALLSLGVVVEAWHGDRPHRLMLDGNAFILDDSCKVGGELLVRMRRA